MFVKLSGEWFNLEPFADQHPGGRLMLESVKGTDATVLFKSLHAFQSSDNLWAIAKKYKVNTSEVPKDVLEKCPEVPQFEWDTPFHKDLKAHLNSYFEKNKREGETCRQASKTSYQRMLLLSVLFVIRMIVWYYHFTAWSVWTLIAAPLAEWIYSSNVFHDASHSSLSINPRLNHFLQHSTFFTTSPSTWFVQHILAHHPYTNMWGYDPDLGRPDTHARIKEGKVPYDPISLFVYWILAQPFLAWVMDPELWYRNIFNSIVPVFHTPFNGYFLHFVGRFLIFSLWCGWALFSAPTLLHALIWSTVPVIIFSITFMFCTQLTHMNEESMDNGNHPQTSRPDWYVHQVKTSVNHSIGSRFWTLFTASLNYQIEHHLYPTVNHCHLPNLQPGVMEICKKHGVPYKIQTVSHCLYQYFELMLGWNIDCSQK
jgi:delta11-fatty-acid desaturase